MYSFNKKAKEVSMRFRDRPMAPLDTATYWVEYVARHKGAPHLRSAATKLTWYQYYLLDVAAFLIFALTIVFYVTYFVLKFLIKKLFLKNRKIKQQ